MIKQQDQDTLQQVLQELVADLQEREEQLKGDTDRVELDQTRIGRLSRMDALQRQQMALAASRRRKQQLAAARLALAAIAAGDYGYCQDCGEDIDIRRLFFDPTIQLCIDCMQKSE